MKADIFSGLIYLLGFIGLFAIGLFPVRFWRTLRNISFRFPSEPYKKIAPYMVVLAISATLWVEIRMISRMFHCLTETYCGPGIASGWFYMALWGAVYLAFEAIIFLLQRPAIFRF
ncbi:hypothetical protein ACLD02_04295 [Alloalcanivorax sp. C16-2]|uniref:hypothetical protein n=1 Tax=Alloalcanivorax sp. C16-2 TaxID=3390052 RepID=UPI003971044D